MMLLRFLELIAANAATIFAARAIAARLRTDKPSTDFLLVLLIRILLISAVVLVAGALHGLTPWVLGTAGCAGLAFFIGVGAHRGWTYPRFPWNRWWTVAAVAIAVRMLLQVWFFSPHLDDALSYHLPKVAEWIRAGRFTSELGLDPRATYPSGFELVEAWWTVFLHHDVLIEMAGVEFLLISGAAAYALARELGWSCNAAIASALLFVMTPGIHLQALSCVNDGPATAMIAATTALILARAHPLLLVVPVALGIGIKPIFPYAFPGLALIAWLTRNRERTPLAAPGIARAVAAAALAVGATWYLRNWIVYGSPVYPMGSEGMKDIVTNSTLQRMGPNWQALRENLAAFLDIRVYDRGEIDAQSSATFGAGAAAFALGMPSLVVLLREDATLRRIAAGYAVSMLCIFSLVVLDLFFARFVLFAALLPALALPRLWERHRLVAGLAAAAVLLQFFGTMVPGNLPAGRLSSMVGRGWRERTAVPPPGGTGPVGFLTDNFGDAYPLYGPDYSRRVVYLREKTVDALMARLKSEGAAVFYVEGGLKLHARMLQEAEDRHLVRRIAEGRWKGYAVVDGR